MYKGSKLHARLQREILERDGCRCQIRGRSENLVRTRIATRVFWFPRNISAENFAHQFPDMLGDRWR